MSVSPTKIYYAWVTTWNTTAGTGTDPQVYISHEVLEMITDPDANAAASGWTSSTFCPTGENPCELSDQCELTTGVGNYTSLTGVNCWSSSYYSNRGGGCVIPGIVNATASATQNFVWGGGNLLQNAIICLIFAGSGTVAWNFTNSNTPTAGTADDIRRGVQTLLTNTQYYNEIVQYSVNKPKFSYAAINSTTSIPNPFQEAHIQQVVKDSINAGTVPNPASNTDPIVYVVVVNNSGATGPKYLSSNTVGNHGTFSFTPAPPTNVPTTNAPAGQSVSLQGDQWGITEIYPTRTTGTFSTAWFLPSNPNSDTRHVVDTTTFTAQADGSYRNTQTNVIYNIAQSNGFTEASLTLNQGTLATQYHMQDAHDWLNVEMTLFVRLNTIVNSTHSGPPNLMLAMRGAKETNDATVLGSTGLPKSCEAADYRVYIEPVSGIIKLQKDLQYTAGITPTASNPSATSPLVGLTAWQQNGVSGFVGLKAICYNLSDGKSVAIELWMDTSGANNWVQIIRYVDSGNWSAVSNGCTGTTNQQINWGGPICKFIWNNISSIDIKYASIREIDVYALNPQLLTSPSITSPTTPPTSSPPNNLPQSPPPPNQSPPASAGTGTLDKFGVKMIYPSISGGQSWYLSARGLKGDSRVIGIPSWVREYVNGDGSFHLSTNSAVTFFVSTLAGYSYQGCGGSTVSHALARVRQYLFSTRDWKNVEITVFHNIEMTVKNGKTYDFGVKCRTGSHSRQRDCQGSAYEIQTLCFPGSEGFRHRKEQWHDSHTDDRTASFGFSSVINRWVGEKFIAYNIVDSTTGHVTGVRLEHWWNDNGDGVTWTKVNNTTDIGGWGFLDALCGGDIDEKIIWGGPLVGFFWNDFTRVDYKWLSVREIDTAQHSSPPGGPPSVSPPVGPPPKPPATSALIGPNAYNVFKFPSNVILDDTGGCGGIDPNAHLGLTQIGSDIPGTGGTINLANITGAAFIAGQQIRSTSSLLYNKVLAEVDFKLRVVGLPTDSLTQPVYCTIRRGIDGLLVSTLGTVYPNQLTSQFQTVVFKTPSLSNYTLGGPTAGDTICIEYYGGDASNYVQVETDNTSNFDSTNSVAVDFLVGGSGWSTITGSDMAGSFFHTGQTGTQPTIFYNVPGPAQTGTVTGAPLRYAAEVAILGGSLLIGRTFYEIDVYMAKVGNPTGAATVYVVDGSGNTKIFGSIDVSTLQDFFASGNTFGLYPFFGYSNTVAITQNGRIGVSYTGGDSSNYVVISEDSRANGTAYDNGSTDLYTSTDGVKFNLVFGGTAPNVESSDLCAVAWTATPPPPGTLPPGTNVVNKVYTIARDIPNPNAYMIMGGIIGYEYVFGGILINDNKSQLIGQVIREVDFSLAVIGTSQPQGSVQVFIFNAAGVVVGSSNTYDVKDIGTVFASFRFTMGLNPAGYQLQVGDRIVLFFSGIVIPAGQPAVTLAISPVDGFDGNHTVLTGFKATGLYPNGGTFNKWLGYGGSWVVFTSYDVVGNVYI